MPGFVSLAGSFVLLHLYLGDDNDWNAIGITFYNHKNTIRKHIKEWMDKDDGLDEELEQVNT